MALVPTGSPSAGLITNASWNADVLSNEEVAMGSLSSMTQAVEVTVQGFLQLRDACARTGLSMEELSDAIGKLQLAAGKEWDVVVEEPDVEPFRLEPRARRGMMLEGDIPCR